jgi:hypothetical protein
MIISMCLSFSRDFDRAMCAGSDRGGYAAKYKTFKESPEADRSLIPPLRQ